jgi:demethylmenaquinone methyltransferase/2-methoxy-6-polyprenyl-1,4-benzoquinol methylase
MSGPQTTHLPSDTSSASGANPSRASGTTTFGFREVAEEERQGLVNQVFSGVAERYDLMNDLMSGGLHRLWKDDFMVKLNPPKGVAPFRLIDVAGGKALASGGAGMNAIVCDISPEMLAVGKRKIAEAGLSERIATVVGNAEELPFADKSFDAYTIAFGIRNVTHIDRALAEAYRVLRPGGRFLCLEFSQVDVPILDKLYDFHSFEIIPRLGAIAAGAAEPYRYLVESIRKFPNQRAFASMISAAGFTRVTYHNLTGGVAAIHSGWRI